MKHREFEFTGKIDGKGKFRIPNKKEFDLFLADHPNKMAIVTLKVFEPANREGVLTYYKAVIVPIFEKLFRENGDLFNDVDTALRIYLPVCRRDGDLLDLDKMTKDELVEMIEQAKMLAAEEFSHVIKDIIIN